MRTFLAGATGAVGQALVPLLIDAGHDVVAMTRSPEKAERLHAAGAEPVIADGLDRDAVIAAVTKAKPDAIVHQLTGLSNSTNLRDFDKAFALTNRLRTEGTENLLAGARAVGGVWSFVAQSYAGWPSERSGGAVKTEDDPLDPEPVPSMRRSHEAIRHVERATLEFGGTALRYGGFYGPGTGIAPGGDQLELVTKRKFPIVGDGGGVWSFVHIHDAAAATLAALERGGSGVYNIVDDEPAPVREWLPVLAQAVGAKPPRRIPRWLARLVAGEAIVTMSTEIRGASNAKAKRELGWTPAYPTWREGFAAVLRGDAARTAA
jgi:nucleoside-diphosphate-sugar epimerase